MVSGSLLLALNLFEGSRSTAQDRVSGAIVSNKVFSQPKQQQQQSRSMLTDQNRNGNLANTRLTFRHKPNYMSPAEKTKLASIERGDEVYERVRVTCCFSPFLLPRLNFADLEKGGSANLAGNYRQSTCSGESKGALSMFFSEKVGLRLQTGSFPSRDCRGGRLAAGIRSASSGPDPIQYRRQQLLEAEPTKRTWPG